MDQWIGGGKKKEKKKSITFFAVCIWKVSLSCRCTVEIRGRKGGREREREGNHKCGAQHTPLKEARKKNETLHKTS